MKKIKKAFTVTEIVVALFFVGIVSVLCITNISDAIKISETKTAYNIAYEKVLEAAAEAKITPPSTEAQAQLLWSILDKNLGIVGYVDKACSSGEKFTKENCKLHKGATWHKDIFKTDENGKKTDEVLSMTSSCLGDCKSGDIVDNETGQSPWLVTENGYAFAVNTSSGFCKNSAYIYNIEIDTASTRKKPKKIEIYSCADVFVDINGPNKGPNEYYDMPIEKDDLNKILKTKKVDRFHIYVTSDGASTSPYDQDKQLAFIEYWMHQR